jgi:hypothetical protein
MFNSFPFSAPPSDEKRRDGCLEVVGIEYGKSALDCRRRYVASDGSRWIEKPPQSSDFNTRYLHDGWLCNHR